MPGDREPPKRLALTMPLGLKHGAEDGEDRIYPAVLIKEGIYQPGIGMGAGLRVRFRSEVLARLAPTMEGKKVDLDHFQDIENEVGFVRGVNMKSKAMRGDMVLQHDRAKFEDAVGFVEGRLESKQVPNVSVEIENPRYAEAPIDEEDWDLDLIDGEFGGVAILAKGACSDKEGCGIGLSHFHISDDKEPTITVPAPKGHGNKNHKEETTMGDNDDPGSCTCGGGKDTELKALRAKAAEVDDLKASLQEKQTEVDTLKAEAATMKEKVDAYAEAERAAMLDAVKEAAPKDTDLKAILGTEPEEADLRSLEVALSAFKASGQRTGMGRHTAGKERDPNDLGSAAEHYARARKRLGLTSKPGEGMPPVLVRNSGTLFKTEAEE